MTLIGDELSQGSFDGWHSEIPWSFAGIKNHFAVDINNRNTNRKSFIITVDLTLHTIDHHGDRELELGDTLCRQNDPLVDVFGSIQDTCIIAFFF